MPDAVTELVGTDATMRLELSFELSIPIADLVTLRGGKQRQGDRAVLGECLHLINQLEHLLSLCEGARDIRRRDPDATPREIAEAIGPDHSDPARSPVKQLHYGSPFLVEVLLGALTLPGLAVLLYTVRRLYGFDLELLTYREQRRSEYLEAKAIREALEENPPSVLEVENEHPYWKLRRGVVTEDDAP